jgi:hypothetical protein
MTNVSSKLGQGPTVDHFSKMEILVACKKNITTKAAIAKIFFEHV